jgi:hypothetical protein
MTTENTSAPTTYYVEHTANFVQLRQMRYKAQFDSGREHPHDVCAIARDVEELRGMVTRCKLTGTVDWCEAQKEPS